MEGAAALTDGDGVDIDSAIERVIIEAYNEGEVDAVDTSGTPSTSEEIARAIGGIVERIRESLARAASENV